VAKEIALDDEARVKLALMNIIDQDLRRRFRTVEAAADFANVDVHRLHRFRAKQHDQFSWGWIFNLAKSARIRILIQVEQAQR
jgi:hypothetical protein